MTAIKPVQYVAKVACDVDRYIQGPNDTQIAIRQAVLDVIECCVHARIIPGSTLHPDRLVHCKDSIYAVCSWLTRWDLAKEAMHGPEMGPMSACANLCSAEKSLERAEAQ